MEESSMSLTACDDLARFDTREQADDMAKELADDWFLTNWVVIRHHNHYHVIAKEIS